MSENNDRPEKCWQHSFKYFAASATVLRKYNNFCNMHALTQLTLDTRGDDNAFLKSENRKTCQNEANRLLFLKKVLHSLIPTIFLLPTRLMMICDYLSRMPV